MIYREESLFDCSCESCYGVNATFNSIEKEWEDLDGVNFQLICQTEFLVSECKKYMLVKRLKNDISHGTKRQVIITSVDFKTHGP